MKIKQNNDILDIPLLLQLPDARANLFLSLKTLFIFSLFVIHISYLIIY